MKNEAPTKHMGRIKSNFLCLRGYIAIFYGGMATIMV